MADWTCAKCEKRLPSWADVNREPELAKKIEDTIHYDCGACGQRFCFHCAGADWDWAPNATLPAPTLTCPSCGGKATRNSCPGLERGNEQTWKPMSLWLS